MRTTTVNPSSASIELRPSKTFLFPSLNPRREKEALERRSLKFIPVQVRLPTFFCEEKDSWLTQRGSTDRWTLILKEKNMYVRCFLWTLFNCPWKLFILAAFDPPFNRKLQILDFSRDFRSLALKGWMDGLFSHPNKNHHRKKNHLAYCLLWQNSCCCRRIFLMMRCNARCQSLLWSEYHAAKHQLGLMMSKINLGWAKWFGFLGQKLYCEDFCLKPIVAFSSKNSVTNREDLWKH